MASPSSTFLAPPKLDDEYQNFASKALRYTLITFMLLTIPVMLSGNTVAHNVVAPLALAFFGLCYLLLQNKGLQIGATLFVSMLWLIITVTIYTHNGLNNVGFFLYVVVIIYTNLLFASRRLVIGITLLSCFSGIILIIGHSYAILPLRSTAPSLIDRLIMGIGLFTSTGILLSSSAKVLQKSFQHIRESEQELHVRNLELESLTEQLRISEERFRIISSVTSDYTFSSRLNPDGELEHILLTGAFEAISGYSPEEFLKNGGWQATLHPDDIEEDERAMNELKQNKPVMSEVRIIKKNGDVRWVRVYAHPVWDTKQNRLIGINGGVQDITQRKLAEEALRESEHRYRTLVEAFPDVITVRDYDGNLIYTNPALEEQTGLSMEEANRIGSFYYVHPEDREIVRQAQDDLMNNDKQHSEVIENRLVINNITYWYRGIMCKVQYEGKPALMIITRNITEHKAAETALRESEEKYRLLYTSMNEGSGLYEVIYDEDGHAIDYLILEVNPGYLRITGHSKEQVVGKFASEIAPPRNLSRYAQVVATGKPIIFEGYYPELDKYFHSSVFHVGGARFATIFTDITERKKAEEAILNLNTELESKANQLTTLNEIAHDISLVTDLSSTLKRVLAILQSILPIDAFFVALYDTEIDSVSYPIMYDKGRFYNQEPIMLNKTSWASQVINSGQPLLINRTPEEIQAMNKPHTRVGDTNQVSASVIMTPLPIGNKNIGVISVQSYTFNIYNEKHMELLTGAGYQIAIAVENARLYDSLQNELAERKRLESELQEYTNKLEILVDERTHGMRLAKEQVELILDNTSDALLFAEPNGDIIVTNPAFRDGFGQQDIRSIEHIFAYIDDEEQIRLISSAMLNVIQHGQSQRVTVQVSPNHNGVKKDLDIALIPVRSSEEEPLSGILLSGRDITQQKEMERFKARFVADALHDLATPISGISMRTYLLERSPDQLKEHVQALQNQVQHLTNLLEDLRTLSRLDRAATELNIEKANINQLVRLVFDTYEPVAMDKEQQLTLRLEQSLPELSIDQRQIERVLVNLVSNAVNYTGGNKEIVIETLQDAETIIINVIDEGMGIEAEDLPHVFERFYRTDAARQNKESGTGLGLAITKEIVELHGGTVSAISEIGIGSTFTIKLPL